MTIKSCQLVVNIRICVSTILRENRSAFVIDIKNLKNTLKTNWNALTQSSDQRTAWGVELREANRLSKSCFRRGLLTLLRSLLKAHILLEY
jgi:L-lactate utilization protein LutB